MSRSAVSVSTTLHTQHLCIRAQQCASCAGVAEGTKKVRSSLHATRSGRLPTLRKETVASTEPTVAKTRGQSSDRASHQGPVMKSTTKVRLVPTFPEQ